ncbi:hypothetical protein DVH24_038259 [Malus domestica]|uniref:Uncharacterized protein n=1 Tax=Malus domestica TaxID=3750 RepID=A0A498KDZ7_MALDO|nr:hypothetical protein DVH24_038259 [Malus domestica]
MCILISTWHEAFWELTDFGFRRNSEVKRERGQSNHRMGDPPGSSRVNSQKQNLEDMVRAQNGQYRAMVESSPGCGQRRPFPITTAELSAPYGGPSSPPDLAVDRGFLIVALLLLLVVIFDDEDDAGEDDVLAVRGGGYGFRAVGGGGNGIRVGGGRMGYGFRGGRAAELLHST